MKKSDKNSNKKLIDSKTIVLSNLDKIHTTSLGLERIKRNLKLNKDDIIGYLKNKIKDNKSNIYKQGKNYYSEVDNMKITINSHNFCVITVHLIK